MALRVEMFKLRFMLQELVETIAAGLRCKVGDDLLRAGILAGDSNGYRIGLPIGRRLHLELAAQAGNGVRRVPLISGSALDSRCRKRAPGNSPLPRVGTGGVGLKDDARPVGMGRDLKQGVQCRGR